MACFRIIFPSKKVLTGCNAKKSRKSVHNGMSQWNGFQLDIYIVENDPVCSHL